MFALAGYRLRHARTKTELQAPGESELASQGSLSGTLVGSKVTRLEELEMRQREALGSDRRPGVDPRV